MTPTTGRWLSVAKAADIPVGRSLIVRLDDVPVAVFHLADGWYSIEDVCTHDGGELTGGDVEGAVIVCPRHGARFSITTGEVLSPPAYEDVPTFPVRVEGGIVQVRDNRWD